MPQAAPPWLFPPLQPALFLPCLRTLCAPNQPVPARREVQQPLGCFRGGSGLLSFLSVWPQLTETWRNAVNWDVSSQGPVYGPAGLISHEQLYSHSISEALSHQQ